MIRHHRRVVGPDLPRVRRGRPAFSLLELMIAIIILGLGLVMVATMFPVAWERARQLSDFTVQKASLANAHAAASTLLKAAGPPGRTSSFAGDLILLDASTAASNVGGWASDDWVHALNMENINADARQFVDERPWVIERASDLFGDLNTADLGPGSYQQKQIRFHQRLQPPARRRDGVDVQQKFADPDDEWDEGLDTRRFAWCVLHRLREPVADPNATRSFDMYYVLLRRSQPTYRFAMQDPRSAPYPNDLNGGPVNPAALGPDQDLMFPVAWRVQVQFPPATDIVFKANATGVPTEITVPPPGVTRNREQIVQMFQTGTLFVDEVKGYVFRVVRRRLTGDDADTAVLTLEREVFVEDLDLPAGDTRCDTCAIDQADAAELLRTVWVYPPPVEPRADAGEPLVFVGSPPVVDIEVHPLSLSAN